MNTILQRTLVWDAHGCLPLQPDADISAVRRYKTAGVDFVSLNVGMDYTPLEDVLHTLAHFRRYFLDHPDEFVLAGNAADVHAARAAGKLAVAFDLEGSEPLQGDAALVEVFHGLGVRQMLLAYNRNNRASSGCQDEDTGLTAYGRNLVRAMNRVGMIVDCSHMGRRATLDAMAVSTQAVIFSHSNAAAVHPHPRNISDEQIEACAQTGGVVGINGLGLFLGEDNDASAGRLFAHIDHIASLVGHAHVGLGLDYVFDQEELRAFLQANPETYPAALYQEGVLFVAPEQVADVVALMAAHGYSEEEMTAVLGGNFLRVAQQVWQ